MLLPHEPVVCAGYAAIPSLQEAPLSNAAGCLAALAVLSSPLVMPAQPVYAAEVRSEGRELARERTRGRGRPISGIFTHARLHARCMRNVLHSMHACVCGLPAIGALSAALRAWRARMVLCVRTQSCSRSLQGGAVCLPVCQTLT